MPISDPYHPLHYGGYTRVELLLSLQLQFEVLSRRVLELEVTPLPPPCLCQYAFDPPHSSLSPFALSPAALTPFSSTVMLVSLLASSRSVTYFAMYTSSRRGSHMFAICFSFALHLSHQYNRFLILCGCITFDKGTTIELGL
ncbi:hypothetical protein Hanom_Chr17g01573031 [Helianthus anomalus]